MDIRDSFGSVDRVGEYMIFNIGGNNFRLITIIAYKSSTVYIRHVLTHNEYDRGKWRI